MEAIMELANQGKGKKGSRSRATRCRHSKTPSSRLFPKYELSILFSYQCERITMPKRGVNWAFLKINTN
jgi:hypothetical protein